MKKIFFFLLMMIIFSSCQIFRPHRSSAAIGFEVVGKYFYIDGKPTGYKPRNKKEYQEYKAVMRQMKEDRKIKLKKEAITNDNEN